MLSTTNMGIIYHHVISGGGGTVDSGVEVEVKKTDVVRNSEFSR